MTRITGVVASYSKGFGFIQLGNKLVEGDDKPEEVFVFNDQIVMTAYEPVGLRRGMHVSFNKAEVTEGKNKGKFHAEDVRTVKGEPISWYTSHGEFDRAVFDEIHTGVVAHYDHEQKFGYLLAEAAFDVAGESITKLTRFSAKKQDFILNKNLAKGNVYTGLKVKFKVTKFGEKWGATYITDLNGKPLGAAKKEMRKYNQKFSVDEKKRYTGRVLHFNRNNFGFIQPDDDLTDYNISHKLWFKAEDINTALRPVVAIPGMIVSFTLEKEKKTVIAKDISMPDGSELEIPDEHTRVSYEENVPRESYESIELTGSVKAYFWDKGYGIAKIDGYEKAEIPEELKEDIKDGSVYFRWSDIKSNDKTVGIEVGEKIKFNLYKDKRGVGAENITDKDGNAIADADRSKATKPRRKWGKRKWNASKGKKNTQGKKKWVNRGHKGSHWRSPNWKSPNWQNKRRKVKSHNQNRQHTIDAAVKLLLGNFL